MSSLSVLPGEPLARHLPLRTGGPCGAYVVAHDVDGVAEVVADCRAAEWKLTVLGAGTRTVARDGPLDGAFLRLGTGFTTIASPEPGTFEVGAAYPLPALVGAAARGDRTGLERFACAPGSVAASLLLDDGWDGLVAAVRVLRRGKPVEIELDEARSKRPVVLGARIVLAAAEAGVVEKKTRDAWGKQRPVPCGSWYEGPRKTSLRTALRAVRLTMVRLREVAIPDAAPELLVNLGGGTAADLQLLHRSALERLRAVQGDDFGSRVRWLG